MLVALSVGLSDSSFGLKLVAALKSRVKQELLELRESTIAVGVRLRCAGVKARFPGGQITPQDRLHVDGPITLYASIFPNSVNIVSQELSIDVSLPIILVDGAVIGFDGGLISGSGID